MSVITHLKHDSYTDRHHNDADKAKQNDRAIVERRITWQIVMMQLQGHAEHRLVCYYEALVIEFVMIIDGHSAATSSGASVAPLHF